MKKNFFSYLLTEFSDDNSVLLQIITLQDLHGVCNDSILSGSGHLLALQDGSRWITRLLILLLYS